MNSCSIKGKFDDTANDGGWMTVDGRDTSYFFWVTLKDCPWRVFHRVSLHMTLKAICTESEFAGLISWLHFVRCDSCRWREPGDSTAECTGHQQTYPSGMYIKSYNSQPFTQWTKEHITCNLISTLYMKLHCSYFLSLYGFNSGLKYAMFYYHQRVKPHCTVLTLYVLQVSSAAEAVPTVTHVRTSMCMDLPAPHLYIQSDQCLVSFVALQPPEVVEDFVRNFLVKMRMTRTAECFQAEW